MFASYLLKFAFCPEAMTLMYDSFGGERRVLRKWEGSRGGIEGKVEGSGGKKRGSGGKNEGLGEGSGGEMEGSWGKKEGSRGNGIVLWDASRGKGKVLGKRGPESIFSHCLCPNRRSFSRRPCPARLLSPQLSVNSAGNRAKLTTWEWTLLTTSRKSLLSSWNKEVGGGSDDVKGLLTVLEWWFLRRECRSHGYSAILTGFPSAMQNGHCSVPTSLPIFFLKTFVHCETNMFQLCALHQKKNTETFFFIFQMFYKSSRIPLFTQRKVTLQ